MLGSLTRNAIGLLPLLGLRSLFAPCHTFPLDGGIDPELGIISGRSSTAIVALSQHAVLCVLRTHTPYYWSNYIRHFVAFPRLRVYLHDTRTRRPASKELQQFRCLNDQATGVAEPTVCGLREVATARGGNLVECARYCGMGTYTQENDSMCHVAQTVSSCIKKTLTI